MTQVGAKYIYTGSVIVTYTAVGQKCDEDMRFHARPHLMVHRPDCQVALEALERRFDFRELYVALPQCRRVFTGQVRAQQIVAKSVLPRP